ncbi:diguanylate cyclase [[Clostridium] symbiosum]|nr:diguanylate cyclase [[Clostridium] symbiosum]MCB6608793.1 diguanylate cyclase [[Clostridium] symbiosum]MCB6929605.1 diguanylate cyclase [[Clostridium] symbiosum]
MADATHFSCCGISVDISCSIGVALFDDKTGAFGELYRKADAAMYRTKQSSDSNYIINTD